MTDFFIEPTEEELGLSEESKYSVSQVVVDMLKNSGEYEAIAQLSYNNLDEQINQLLE